MNKTYEDCLAQFNALFERNVPPPPEPEPVVCPAPSTTAPKPKITTPKMRGVAEQFDPIFNYPYRVNFDKVEGATHKAFVKIVEGKDQYAPAQELQMQQDANG